MPHTTSPDTHGPLSLLYFVIDDDDALRDSQLFEQAKAGVDIPVYPDSDLYDDNAWEEYEYDPTEDSETMKVDSNVDLLADDQHSVSEEEDLPANLAGYGVVAPYGDGSDEEDPEFLIEPSSSSPTCPSCTTPIVAAHATIPATASAIATTGPEPWQ
ncbi:hypothetical protein DPSP01_008558 [Paraphaeosphaeria sporulosa]